MDTTVPRPLSPTQKALAEACRTNDLTQLVSLLRQPVELNFCIGETGWSPLQIAVEMGNMSILTALLTAGADPNFADFNGWSALHQAVDVEADGAYQSGIEPRPDASRKLLENGADADLADNNGTTPRSIAKAYEYSAFLELLSR